MEPATDGCESISGAGSTEVAGALTKASAPDFAAVSAVGWGAAELGTGWGLETGGVVGVAFATTTGVGFEVAGLAGTGVCVSGGVDPFEASFTTTGFEGVAGCGDSRSETAGVAGFPWTGMAGPGLETLNGLSAFSPVVDEAAALSAGLTGAIGFTRPVVATLTGVGTFAGWDAAADEGLGFVPTIGEGF